MDFKLKKLYEEVALQQNIDQEYLDAIQNNDSKTVLRLVKNQRQIRGFRDQLFSGSLADRGNVYKRAEQNGIWLSKDEQTAREYSIAGGNQNGIIRNLSLSSKNPLDIRELGIQNNTDNIKRFLENKRVLLPDLYYQEFQKEMEREEQDTWFCYAIIDGRDFKQDRALAIKQIERAGFDSLIIKDTHYGSQSDSYVAFKSNQVKLNKLVTVDDQSQIIPLSKRFDQNNPDIRY